MKGISRVLLLAAACAGLASCASGAPRTTTLADIKALQAQADQDTNAGRPEQALVNYQKLTAALPTNADAWFRLGNAFVRVGQPDQAVDAYQHALRLEPKHAKAWHNIGVLRLRQAAAAFSESAVDAHGVDPVLQQQSTSLADGIARLTTKPEGGAAATAPADAGHGP